MKFLFILFIIFISFVQNLRLQERDDTVVLKLTESYYNKIGSSNIDEFRNMIFRELDNNQTAHHKIPTNSTNNSSVDNTSHKLAAFKHKESRKAFSHFHLYSGEYLAVNRIIKFYISHMQECSVFINDTVIYENINSANFVEHMILHNNVDTVDPKGVYSDNVSINFFAFNRKLNIFSVYFDPKQKGNSTGFSIEYDYDAISLLKSKVADPNNDNYNATMNYNSFVWKILNQNFLRSKQKIALEVYFDLGQEF